MHKLFRQKHIENRRHKEQCQREKLLDVDVQLKSEEAEIAEGPVQHAHGEQCKQHRPQVAPEDR